MKVTLAQAGIVAGILTLSWVVGGPKEILSAPPTGNHPHQVFNSTSKAHAEKVASLVPDSIVKGDSGHPLNWFVMSKTPYAEARSYYAPWLRENDYFRSNQFLSEVKYEAESFSAEGEHSWWSPYAHMDGNWYICSNCGSQRAGGRKRKPNKAGCEGHKKSAEYDFSQKSAESFSADWLVKRKKCKRPYCTKPIIVDFSGYCSSRCQAKNEPESYGGGAESFSEAGLELRTAGRCGCEQDDLWEVVNVESPVFLCSTCGYAGNKKEDGHFMHMKNIYDAESHSAEDEDTTTCEDCGVKIGYDEAIDWEGLDRCEDCYDYWMMKDRQNYTGDETDCISCGYSISPNDVRFELVEGLCPDCKADGSFQAEEFDRSNISVPKDWVPKKYPYDRRVVAETKSKWCENCGELDDSEEDAWNHYQFFLKQKNSTKPVMRFISGGACEGCGSDLCQNCIDGATSGNFNPLFEPICDDCGYPFCKECKDEDRCDNCEEEHESNRCDCCGHVHHAESFSAERNRVCNICNEIKPTRAYKFPTYKGMYEPVQVVIRDYCDSCAHADGLTIPED